MVAQLETLSLEHLPKRYQVHLALFHDVKNAEFLQKQLLEGNTEFEYAFLDASMVRIDPRDGVLGTPFLLDLIVPRPFYSSHIALKAIILTTSR